MKARHRRTGLVQKVGKVMTPMTSCLGRQPSAYQYQQITSETVNLPVNKDMILDLIHMFGGEEERAINVGKYYSILTTSGGEFYQLVLALDAESISVSIPKWIVHRFYKCVMTTLSLTKSRPADSSRRVENHNCQPVLRPCRPPPPERPVFNYTADMSDPSIGDELVKSGNNMHPL